MDYTFKDTPFDLDILVLTKPQLRTMTPVHKLNIFEPSSNNFDPEGLFSTEIFGLVGSPERVDTFSYINLKVGVLHPLIYSHIITARLFYKDILAGTKYAVYDEKLQDVVPATEEDGDTGFTFFMDILSKIKLEDRDSDLRKFKILMIEIYGKYEYLMHQMLVSPAGIRDYTVDKSGIPSEDEINDKYRKLLTLSNSLSNITITKDTIKTVDNIRSRLQDVVVDIYDYIISLLDGKRKFLQAKWGSRGIIYGTRNVITPSLSNIRNLRDPNNVGVEHSTVGLYQYTSAIIPIAMHHLHKVFISKIFSPDNNSAYLVNAKNNETQLVNISIKERDKWLTLDGLSNMISKMGQNGLRSEPVMVGDKYLLLLHDDGKTITPVFNTDTMSDEFNTDNLRPLTYYEMLYISLLDTFDKYRAFVTRYPVIDIGGIYPCKIHVKTTDNPRGINVVINNITHAIREYPNFAESYYNSLSPHYAFLTALGGDFDGDKVNFIVLYSDEAIKNIDEIMSKKEFYLTPNGKLVFSPKTDTLEFVITALIQGRVYD